MTPFFFSDIQDNQVSLHDEEAKHCVKVMRKREGEDVIGIDGKGNMYRARIKALGKRRVDLTIFEKVENWGEKSQEITLMVSPLHKVDRFEWLIEKSVELGVTRIIPYIGTHTVKTGIRSDRLERICIAALKQCLRSRLPVLETPVNLSDALKSVDSEVSILAHGPTGNAFRNFENAVSAANSITILIGPEGDFDQSEIEEAISGGFQTVNLGENRLRSETAAIHLLSLVKNAMGY